METNQKVSILIDYISFLKLSDQYIYKYLQHTNNYIKNHIKNTLFSQLNNNIITLN